MEFIIFMLGAMFGGSIGTFIMAAYILYGNEDEIQENMEESQW